MAQKEEDHLAQNKLNELSLVEVVDRLLLQDPRIGWPTERSTMLKKNLHGWLRPGNLEVLEFLLNPDNKLIIELGSWLGLSTTKILKAAPNAVVFAVDIWSNEYFEKDSHYNKDEPDFKRILSSAPIYDQFLTNTEQYKITKTKEEESYHGLIPMKMDSTEALKILHELKLTPDLIYIDASHHYDFVVKDVMDCLNYFPHTTIVGDDWDNLDVRRAVQDVARESRLEVYTHGGTCWTFESRERMRGMARKRREELEEKEERSRKRKEMAEASFGSLLEIYAKKRKG